MAETYISLIATSHSTKTLNEKKNMETGEEVYCISSIPQFLKYGNKYKIIKKIHNSFLIKCYLGYVIKVSPERFINEECFNSVDKIVRLKKSQILNSKF